MIELRRALAPLTARAWERIESDACAMLRTRLAARRLVDFVGPLGWEHSAIDLGPVRLLDGRPPGGALVRLRRVRPLLELRIPFELELEELELVDRGAGRVELAPLHDAAKIFAASEDTALFEGYPEADIPGIISDSTQESVALPEDAAELRCGDRALELLRQAGISGPNGMALGPEPHAALEAAGAGYPVLTHVRRLLDGPGGPGAVPARRRGAEPTRRRLPAGLRARRRDRLPEPRREEGAARPGRELQRRDQHTRGRGAARDRELTG